MSQILFVRQPGKPCALLGTEPKYPHIQFVENRIFVDPTDTYLLARLRSNLADYEEVAEADPRFAWIVKNSWHSQSQQDFSNS
jgi:hypothetical protein